MKSARVYAPTGEYNYTDWCASPMRPFVELLWTLVFAAVVHIIAAIVTSSARANRGVGLQLAGDVQITTSSASAVSLRRRSWSGGDDDGGRTLELTANWTRHDD